jgi:hypothetical protein
MLGPTGLWWVDLICLELLLKIWDGVVLADGTIGSFLSPSLKVSSEQ